MKNLKIGLLVDSLDVNDFNSELIKILEKNNLFKIETIIINKLEKKDIKFYLNEYSFLKIIQKVLFKLIYVFEENFLYKFFIKYNFSKRKIKDLNVDKIFVHPIISKNNYSYSYKENDLNKIREKKLDILIKIGEVTLEGDILNVTKNGVISFQHGDNEYNRARPPGFWEVYYKIPKTGFIIQKLNENLHGNNVLFKGYFQTKLFYYQNKQSIYKKSAKFIENVLLNILENKIVKFEKELLYNKVFSDPTLIELLKYIIVTYSNIIFKIIEKFLSKKILWEVAYKKTKFNENKMDQFNVIINTNKDRFIADPFLFEKDKNTYLFVEDFSFKKNKGAISCYKLNDKPPVFLGKVLEEEFHLSFPFIFKFDDKIYLCPETFQKNEIRLYQSIDFPKKWEFKMTLIKNINAVDTLIFFKNDIWWLITSTTHTEDEDYSEMRIYYSLDGPLTNNWIPHKSNPIYVDPAKARNGGILFEKQKVYRVNQINGFNFYGNKFEINEIVSISKDQFTEKLISKVKPNFFKKAIGTHHLNNNSEFVTFDFCRKKYFFNN